MQITVVGGVDAGRGARLDTGPVRVGRSSSCELVLSDDTVSSMHAVVTLMTPTLVEVVDLGSSNGTSVDGERVNRARRVAIGQRVQFGQTIVALVPETDSGSTVVQSPVAAVPPADVQPWSPPPPPISAVAAAQGNMNVQNSQMAGHDFHVHEGLRLRSRMRSGPRKMLKFGILLMLVGLGCGMYAVLRLQSRIFNFDTSSDAPEIKVDDVFPWIAAGAAGNAIGLTIVVISLLIPRDHVYEEDRRKPRR